MEPTERDARLQTNITEHCMFSITISEAYQFSQGADGILVPGGFGHRGVGGCYHRVCAICSWPEGCKQHRV
uniref:Emb2742 (Embryo defective 2742) n=1 Tax=Arundo donax TaxID=35708 RepID=A0A0A8ZYC0_ARUDO